MFGCGSNSATDGGPFGPANVSPLLAPYAGKWSFDFEKTLDGHRAAGATDEDIQRIRKLYEDNPQLGKLHPDLTIDGNVAVGAGLPSAEYRFFAMHEHDGVACGKAWHHEDRFDPGDMSKCYIRLALKDDCLYLDVKMKDGFPDLSDPDIETPPSGSAENCDADDPAGGDWSDWTTYVFSRST